MRVLAKVLAVMVTASAACAALAANDQLAPKYTIKEIMLRAHKPPANLLRKVAQGKATNEEKAELLELYRVLAENAPPRGEKASWDERTGLLVDAAKAVVDGQPDAEKQLTKVSNCMACHRDHK